MIAKTRSSQEHPVVINPLPLVLQVDSTPQTHPPSQGVLGLLFTQDRGLQVTQDPCQDQTLQCQQWLP